MKKPYILPQARSLRFHCKNLLAASLGQRDSVVTPGDRSDDDYDDYGSQFSGRNTWPRRGGSSVWE